MVDDRELARRIEAIVARLDRPGMPGAAVGVVRSGKTIHRGGFGLASVELGVPISPQTVFSIASVTKQFTCAIALMMAQDGRLDLDADIRRVLPDLPDVGATVSAQHLMRNTAGVRDLLELLRLGGADLSHPISRTGMLGLIRRQRALNFAPGSRFLYSNSNFALLQEMAERVSGRPLRELLAERIFAPLGMERARLREAPDEVIPGFATGYLLRDGALFQAADRKHGGGEGGIRASLDDLLRWAANFDAARVGGADLLRALATPVPYANGRPARYACGLQQLPWRGVETVGHGGLLPGFLTEFLRVPSLGLTVIVMANSDRFSPFVVAREIVDAALDVPHARGRPDPVAFAPAVGLYFAAAAPASFEIAIADEQPVVSANGVPFRLIARDDGRYEALRGGFEFVLSIGDDVMAVEDGAGHRLDYRRIAGGGALPAGLDGAWHSDEVGATWTISGDRLTVNGPFVNGTEWRVLPLDGECARVDMAQSWYRNSLDVRLDRGAGGRPAALLVQGARCRNLRFARVG